MARIEHSDQTRTLGTAWHGDFDGREHIVAGGAMLVASAFTAVDGVTVTTTAAALAAATTVAVTALSAAIPVGTILDFTGAGKFAQLTAAAAAGATSLTVEALPVALASGDTATYAGTRRKRIESGTLLGRTYAERDAGTGFGPAVTASDNEIFLLAYDVYDPDNNPECELYRHGSLVKENFLPAASRAAGPLAAIRERYDTTIGAA